MSEEENGASSTSTETIAEESATEEAETSKNTEVSADELAELKKKADLAENYKIRAEKAERKLKEPSKKEDKGDSEQEILLTPKDTIALVNAKISTDDFETVTDWARFKKIPVSEALKDKTLQTVLREKQEERLTAEVTVTKNANRGGRKLEPEDIVDKARQGHFGEKDEDIQELVKAQMALKMRRLQK